MSTPLPFRNGRLAFSIASAFNSYSSKARKRWFPKEGDDSRPVQPGDEAAAQRQRWRRPELRSLTAILSVLGGVMLVVLDASVANVALPTIARSLGVTPALSLWVITSYQAALLVALLPCAALGESLGYRRVFTGGVGLFTAASALCGLSPSLPCLVLARFLQGLGGAAVLALGMAVIRTVVPPERLGSAIGWNALAVALASAAGPSLGAAILSAVDWPWLFAGHLPLGMLVLVATRAQPQLAGTSNRLDLPSVALNTGAVASFVLGVESLPSKPTLGVLLLILAVLTSATLIRREIPKQAPLIPLDLLRAGSFRISAIASVSCFAGQTAGLVALPYHLQHGLGQGMMSVGLYMSPWPLTVAIMAPLTGRWADRCSPAKLCVLGAGCLSVGLAGLALWSVPGNLLPVVAFTLLGGVGFSLFNVSNNRRIFLLAPPERSGAAGGLQGLARLLGQTAGALFMSLIFTVVSMNAAPRIGLGFGAALALAAGLVSGLEILKGSAVGKSAVIRWVLRSP